MMKPRIAATLGILLLSGIGLGIAADTHAQPGPGDGRRGARVMERGDWDRMGERLFERLDADRNGSVTQAELDAGVARMREEADRRGAHAEGRHRDRAEGRHREGPEGRQARRTEFLNQMVTRIRAYDGNGDGEITRVEFDAGRSQRFGELDRDGDGRLTRDEMRDGSRRG